MPALKEYARKRNAARLFRRAASRSQCFLLQLALSLFGQIELFLDHLVIGRAVEGVPLLHLRLSIDVGLHFPRIKSW